MIDIKRMWALWVIITVIGGPGIALAVPKGPGWSDMQVIRHHHRKRYRKKVPAKP